MFRSKTPDESVPKLHENIDTSVNIFNCLFKSGEIYLEKYISPSYKLFSDKIKLIM